jgi:predicted Zn-dependent protease
MKLKALFLFIFLLFRPTISLSSEIPVGNFIVDDEIESTITQWLQDIFNVAGIRIKPHVFILVDPNVNAGATYGGQVIVFTGLILKCQNAAQILGVLAHESGHIAGAHTARIDAAQQQAMVPAIASTLIGGAAALLTGNSAPLLAGAAGGLQVFERGLLKYSRTQEESADSAALRYLELLNWPSEGLYEFLNLLNTSYNGQIDPYTSTHPLTEDRRSKVRLYSMQQKTTKLTKVPEKYELQFQRIKAKIKGFMEQPQKTLRELPAKDTSVAARYARAIALYRFGKPQEAFVLLDQLLKELPNDPYFLELKGQIFFETGRVKDAVMCYRASVKQRPAAPILNLILAHALIEASPQRNEQELNEAIQALKLTTEKDPENIFAWRLLASAYGKNGQHEHAAGCLAEEAWLKKDIHMAKAQAQKAIQCSNPIIAKRARDILNETKNGEAK